MEKKASVHGTGGWENRLNDHLRFVYDGWNPVLVLRGSDNVVLRKYTWGLDLSGTIQDAGGIGGLLAAVETQGAASPNDDRSYWFFYDANGNVGQVIDATDPWNPPLTLVARYEYDPYGNQVASSGTYADANPFRFSTKWLDGEIGLYYYGYRAYSPPLGRWISRDPIVEQSFHGPLNRVGHVGTEHLLYSFVGNQPVSDWDYLGLDNPGCDTLTGAGNVHELKCCAQHDKCYYDHKCKASSWFLNLGLPIVSGFLAPCCRCNNEVAVCLLLGGPGAAHPYFCPNGKNAGKFYDHYADIPADCWENKQKPAVPAPWYP